MVLASASEEGGKNDIAPIAKVCHFTRAVKDDIRN